MNNNKMAPGTVTRTYSICSDKKKKKKRRPWADIHKVLSEIQNKENTESVTVFDALFKENVKSYGLERCKKNTKYKKRERTLDRKLEKEGRKIDIVNLSPALQDSYLETTFDRILAGPRLQHPNPPVSSPGSKEFNSSSNSENSFSELSSNFTLFPIKCSPKETSLVLESRKKSARISAKAAALSPWLRKSNKNTTNETQEIACLTSTPKILKLRNEEATPYLSPIHSTEKHLKKDANSEVYQVPFDTNKRIEIKIKKEKEKSSQNIPVSRFCSRNESKEKSTSVFLSCLTNGISANSFHDATSSKSDQTREKENYSDQIASCKSHREIAFTTETTDSRTDKYELENLLSCSSQKECINHDQKISCSELLERIMSKDDNSFENSEKNLFGFENKLVRSVNSDSGCGRTNVAAHSNEGIEKRERNMYVNDSARRISEQQFLGAQESLGIMDKSHQEKVSVQQSLPPTGFFNTLAQIDGKPNTVLSHNKSNVGVVTETVNSESVVLDERPLESRIKENTLSKSIDTSLLLFDSWNSVNDSPEFSPEKFENSVDIFKELSCSQDQELSHVFDLSGNTLCTESIGKQFVQDSTAQNEERELLHMDMSNCIMNTDTNVPVGLNSSENCSVQHLLQHKDTQYEESPEHNTGSHHEQINEVGQKDVECDTVSIVKKSLLRQSFRRLSHIVRPDGTRKSSLKSPSFRDVYCRELNATLNEEAENLVNEIAEPVSYVPDVFTARDSMLQRCQQKAPIPFSEAFPSGYWLTCKKIGEGVYGEVFMSKAEDGSVLKIIPVEGETLVNGEPQKKFDEILSEVVIASELSNLRTGVTHRTASFSEMKRCICVQGKYPEELINLWDDYDAQKGSENDSPEMFLEDQLYVILLLANGGCDLESYLFTNSRQTHSVFMQTAFALAVAEFSLQFEHRDLHWGNVLVSQTSKKNVVFRLCDQEYSIPTRGVQVTIIDFTLSRMSYDGCCIYNDLSKDPTLFTAKGDYQFEVYRLMQKCIQNSWHRFEPYTNILWLLYLVDKMCSLVKYRHKVARTHRCGLTTLKELQNDILNYASTSEFIFSENGLRCFSYSDVTCK